MSISRTNATTTAVNKRQAVYAFFAETLGLDIAQADESRVTLLPESALQSFGSELPERALRSREELDGSSKN